MLRRSSRPRSTSCNAACVSCALSIDASCSKVRFAFLAYRPLQPRLIKHCIQRTHTAASSRRRTRRGGTKSSFIGNLRKSYVHSPHIVPRASKHPHAARHDHAHVPQPRFRAPEALAAGARPNAFGRPKGIPTEPRRCVRGSRQASVARHLLRATRAAGRAPSGCERA